MDLGENGIEREVEFWPLEHPTEPPDEDKPLMCPISDTSLANGRKRHDERFSVNLPKRAEISAVVQEQDMLQVAEEPRTVRKRHHTLTTHEDHTIITPLSRMPPPIYPYLVPQNLYIFDVMQHFNKFES